MLIMTALPRVLRGIIILNNTSDDKVKLECSVIVSKVEKFKDELGKLTNANVNIHKI